MAILTLAFWGCSATLFLDPVFIGMSVTALSFVLFVLLLLEVLRRPRVLLDDVKEFVTPEVIARAQVEVCVCLSSTF